MTSSQDRQETGKGAVVVSIDAMGGDQGPAAIVAGIALFARENAGVRFILHGRTPALEPLLAKTPALAGRVETRHAEDVVSMDDKPSQVMRNGKGTSMWSTLEAVRAGEATVAVSCGNTGALMALSMVRLRKLPGISRPAIAILWPARSDKGFNVMLDVGADIRADARDLLQYALMGVSYARNGMALARPRVGLLNVGTEEHKGRPELHEAHALITQTADSAEFDFVGFVEGGDIPGDVADVIVTDGFTGNVALKTAEGTAGLIRDVLRDSFAHSILSRIASVLAYPSLKRLSKRIDPRRVNGGVFLGLNGTVVKSHGAADATGVAAAVNLAYRLAEQGFTDKLKARVASASELAQDAVTSAEDGEDRT